jgi:hypothetical protein
MEKTLNQVSIEPVNGHRVSADTYELTPHHEGIPAYDKGTGKQGALEPGITAVPASEDASDSFDKIDDPDYIIVTGADAATHLLPLRDDGDPSVTFRGIFLASCLSAFQAVMNQIYTVSH